MANPFEALSAQLDEEDAAEQPALRRPGAPAPSGFGLPTAQQGLAAGDVATAEAAAPLLNRQFEREAFRRVQQIQNPATRTAELEALRKLAQKRQQARAKLPGVVAEAQQANDPGLRQRATEALRDANIPGLPFTPNQLLEAGRAGLTGAQLLGGALDWAQSKVRNYTTPGVEGSWNAGVTPEQWNRAIEKKAKAEPLSAAGAFYYPTQAVGDVAGGVVGGGLLAPVFMGADAINRVATGKPLTPPNDPDYWTRQLKDTVAGSQQSAGDLTRSMVADPVSYVSFGAGGAAENALNSARRALTAAGATGDVVQLLKPFEAVLRSSMGTKEGARDAAVVLERLAKTGGLNDDAARAVVNEVVGANGQFLGRGTFRAEIPFTGKGVDLRVPGGGENAIRRAVEASPVGKAFERATGGRTVFDQQKTWVKAEQRMARAVERGANLALADDAKGLMEELNKLGQTNESVRQLLTRTIDPAFDLSPLPMTPELARDIQRAMAGAAPPPTAVTKGQAVFASDGRGGWVLGQVTDVQGRQATLRLAEGPAAGTTVALPRAALRRVEKLPTVLDAHLLDPVRRGQALHPHAKAILHEGEWKLAQPRADYRPLESLTEAEQGAVQAIGRYFERRSREIVKGGGEGAARNLISNRYIPRIYTPRAGALEDVIPKPWAYSPNQPRTTLRPEGAPAQQGGLPLGQSMDQVPASYLKGKMDLADILATYNPRHARTLARRKLEDRLAKQFDVGSFPPKGVRFADLELAGGGRARVPAFVANAMKSTFDRSLMTMGGALRRAGLGQTFVGRVPLGVVDFMGGAQSTFKRNVLSRVPGYHLLNTANDFQQMFAFGVNNPAHRMAQADAALAGKTVRLNGRDVPGEEVLQIARKQNIAVDDVGHLDLDVLPGAEQAKRLNRVLAGQAPESAARRLYDLDLRFGEALTNRTRLGMFIDGLERGMSPAEAGKRVFDALIDYQDLPAALQVARWVMPFATWAAKAPAVTARALARNPGRVSFMKRAVEEFVSDQEKPPMADPKYLQERGWTVPLKPEFARALGNLREAAGGTPYDPGVQYSWLPRVSVFDEALNLPLQLAQGNPDPLALSAGGLPKFLMEYQTQEDLMTKQPLSRIDPLALFPAGTPGVPPALTAARDQASWSRYLAPYVPVVGAPPVTTAVNRALWQTDPARAPYAAVGMTRAYAPENPSDQWFYTLLNLLTRSPVYEVRPSAGLRNVTDRPEIKQVMQDATGRKRQEEQGRRLRRLGY